MRIYVFFGTSYFHNIHLKIKTSLMLGSSQLATFVTIKVKRKGEYFISSGWLHSLFLPHKM